MLEIKNVTKVYKTKEKIDVCALNSINITFSNTGLVFILGPSGSGKTTLLNLIGGIDDLTDGQIYLDGVSLSSISLDEYRRNTISFVFQEYNLLNNLNVSENISLVTSTKSKEEKNELVSSVLKSIGLEGYEKRRIQELSGGQKQRIAIGRALAKGCNILLCDEPTGNLDSRSSNEIFEVLKNVAKDKLVIVVSHNQEMALKYADRIISICDGNIKSDVQKTTIDSKRDKTENNKMSFAAKIKYGTLNLSSCKLKTIVSTFLIILSTLATCFMVILLTYDSDYINARLSKDDSLGYLVDNDGTSDEPFNTYCGGKIPNIDSIFNGDIHAYGYEIQNSIFYIINEENEDLINSFSFYFKEDLTDESCYITDYYLLFFLSKNSNYEVPSYSEFCELKNAKIYYKGVHQYNIAGIIKTDYLDYYDEFGNEIYGHEYTTLEKEQERKLNCEYKALYGSEGLFLSMSFGSDFLSYYEESGKNIFVENNNSKKRLKSLKIEIINDNTEETFYSNSGYFGSLNYYDEYTKKIPLNQNEILVSPDLYDALYGTEIDWRQLGIDISDGINNESPVTNILPHLGETISLEVIDVDGEVIEINNVVIVGVIETYEYGDDENKFYKIIGNDHLGGMSNSSLTKRVICLVDWKNVKNRLSLLKKAREKNLLLAGVKYNVAYYNEEIRSIFGLFFEIMAIVLSLISCLAIINLVIHRINDNKKEIGILYAAGCNKNDVRQIFMIPIFVITLISIIISTILLMIGCRMVNVFLSDDEIGYLNLLVINWQTILALIATIFIILFLSLIPLNKYLSKKPIEIIK